MPDCLLSVDCPFFKGLIRRSPEATERMKKRFCMANPAECARLRVYKAKGRHALPYALMPDDYEQMNQILTTKAQDNYRGPSQKKTYIDLS
ncbi:MAG: hypothetical protein NC924_05960 [Candidatus Omnitrophica bacterium]|nr:hypothetical protein [Candidatus Omnitrophota bacterium]